MNAPDVIRAALEHATRGQTAQALVSLRRLVQRSPRDAHAVHALGLVLFQSGQNEQAEFYYRRSVELSPTRGAYRNNLAYLLTIVGRSAEAVEHLRAAIAAEPEYYPAHVGLSRALVEMREYDAAIASARRAIGLSPDGPQPYVNLGIALVESGRPDEAAAELRAAVARMAGNESVLAALLATLNYVHDADPGQVLALHRRFGELISVRAGAPAPLANPPDPDRRVRIGYISPDLRTHSVAFFLEPVLGAHDSAAFETFCYSTLPSVDETTRRLQKLAGHWHDGSRQSDEALSAKIRTDGIDILIDLAGHTGGQRMGVLARRPAPVIATWIGYPNTTGMPAIGYRIVDAITDPPREADALATERLVRLPGCFLCYRPPDEAPEPAPASGARSGHITFGSFNLLAKLSPPTLEAWCAILARVPGSRLYIKNRALADAPTRKRLLDRLTSRRVAADRIELAPPTASVRGHLDQYAKVDIALDPFPYNGTTTTCEALWMGVPVVCLEGRVHAGRVGVSLLNAAGLPELVAPDVDAYVGLAAALAMDPGRLAALRTDLRRRMGASALCDGAAFTRGLESALRGLWREWCATSAPPSSRR